MKPIPERVEEFKKEFWKLSGDSVTELDRKQDEYVQNMLTETDQQARSEILEFIGRWKAETDTGSQEVDRLYLMLKALSNPPSQV
jgi:uncharacterized protein with von Willebrand factor type A (vWA) domain